MKKTIYILLALLLVVTGCSQEPPAPPSIETGGDITIYVGDSVKVEAQVLPEGSSQKLIYSLSGEGISNISDYITVDGNGVLHAIALPDKPEFTLSIVSPEYGISGNVKVWMQYDPKGGIESVDSDSIVVSSSKSYSQEVKVRRNTEKTSFYSISDVPEWIDVRLVGKDSLVDTYEVTVSENKSPDQRDAVIMFGDHAVTITQKGAVWLSIPDVTEIHAGAELKLEAVLMPMEEIAAVEWYILGPEDINGYVEVVDGLLKSYKPYSRAQEITLYAYDREHDIYGKSVVKVTVDPASGIDSISPSGFRLETSEGGEFSFSVVKKTLNTTFYEVLGIPSWIEPVSEVSEGMTATHTFRIAENLSGMERSADLMIGSNVFRVSQIANAASIEPVERKLVTNLDSFTEIHPGTSFDITAWIESSDESIQDLKYWAEIECLAPSDVERFIGVSPSGHVDVHAVWEGSMKVALHVASPVYGFSESRMVDLTIDPEAGILGVAPAELPSIDASGNGSVEFTVERRNDSFFPYDVSVDASWLTVLKTGSSGRVDTYSVSAYPNPGMDGREATITLPGLSFKVKQDGFSGNAVVPASIVFDGFSPSWDGRYLYIGNEYAISAHVYPSGAPQDLKYGLKSRGTGHGHGSQNRFVDDSAIPAFIEFDPEKGTIKPFNRGEAFYSPDYDLVISTPDGSVTTTVPFTIAYDSKAGINGVVIPGAEGNFLEIESHGKSRTRVEVSKNTALSTVVGFESSESWLSARKIGEREDGMIDIWEIGVAPNRGPFSRSGKITFIGNNNTGYSIPVTQPGEPSPERHTEWVYGVVPPEPWEYVHDQNVGGDYIEIYERSDIDQGWYLVTKSMLSNQSQTNPDERLCWAMSAASMIHWWGDHNERYVEAFKAMHPGMSPAIDITYDRNAALVKDKSSIIPIFTARHADTGGHTNVALLDILFRPRNTGRGEPRNLGNGRFEWGDLPHRQYPGWFHEVFRGHEDEMVKISHSNQKSDFHRMIDEALVFDKAIGLNVHYYKVSGNGADHAMNVWGITYDENGEIVELVVGDNNLNSQRLSEPNLAYLTNYMVSYTTDNVVELWNPAFDMSNPDYHAMGEVNELILLDLGTMHWEKWAFDNGLSI